ncbi:alkanesulfonate monooxygenase SsuD/methylene tetrahydromethanopterin reductase-like flavin-dependent oxidoreductase (luciferase family) [Nocardia transvalensis]|uniref:Alkanesulfonate monooxygenase SsuD/methylene tetrahydromethanopterin reductase-like flavin-dependent oxidoreductase (Luciferase family) n=1 Tax=Nocardia transvalensis TaxID=37333 RepID=A0A7W9PCU0_9NOCA|nr:LLM class flavin-dependent oxidoreductase [Nocardia transvalensis]MBB5913333.1 alkanesulfonate monooxygenase SsuD/methylene tetrahydromethanopterin reductase-like flavin-dependent oxidoreductase (luciferase family) [Nocardia transvalensis]
MTTIRFATMQVPRSGADWVRAARAAEEQGYHTLLLPDTLNTASPFPALAAAAAVTGELRLRPNVLAAPLRPVAGTVRETAALQQLSDGRFELGIGIGRPDAAAEAERLGLPWGSATERRAHLAATVAAVRAEVDPAPPVVIAASGPRGLAAAAEIADRILVALLPHATEEDLAAVVARVRDHTNRPVAFSSQLVGIGDRMPRWPGSWQVPSPAELRAAGAVGLLPENPAEAADLLLHRREKYGIDELIVPGDLSEAFAPMLERLR